MLNPVLRKPEVKAATGMPNSTLYLRIAQGLFPAPVRLGPKSVAWPTREVAAINAARIAGQTDDQIRELVKQLHAARTILAHGVAA